MDVEVGRVYKHFKGNYYEVIAVGTHTTDMRKVVIYAEFPYRFPSSKVWVRDYDEFVSKVDKDKYPHANQSYRFEPLASSLASTDCWNCTNVED